MKWIKIIDIYECGHSYELENLLVPDNMRDIVKKHPRPCMSCLAKQWEEDKKQGFSLRGMLHQVLQEEEEEVKY